jgi:hypothetical protein
MDGGSLWHFGALATDGCCRSSELLLFGLTTAFLYGMLQWVRSIHGGETFSGTVMITPRIWLDDARNDRLARGIIQQACVFGEEERPVFNGYRRSLVAATPFPASTNSH